MQVWQWAQGSDRAALGVLVSLVAVACLAFPVPAKYMVIGTGLAAVLLANARPAPAGSAQWGVAMWGLVFISSTAASIVFSVSPIRSLEVAVTILPGTIVAYLIATQYTPRQVDYLVSVLVAVPAIAGGYLSWLALTHRSLSPQQWLAMAGYQHLSVPNDLLFLALLAPFSCALLVSAGQTRVKRVAALGSLVLVGTCLMLYESRTGALLLAVALAAAASRRSTSLGWALVAGGVLVGLSAAVDALRGFAMMHKLMAIGTVTSRVPLWLAAWHMFVSAPWLGLGPGAFSVSYDAYLAHLHVPQWVVLDPRHMPWAHNLYLELLAERGALGLAPFLALLAVAARQANRAVRRCIEPTVAALASRDTLYLILAAGCVELSLLRLWLIMALAVVLGIIFSFHDTGDHHHEAGDRYAT